MSDNVLETVRATVQDFIAPELKTHGVRLENIERRLDDMKHSFEQRLDDYRKSAEQRSDDLRSALEHRILDSKETLRAEMQALEARMDARFLGIENLLQSLEARMDARFLGIENLLRNLIQQGTIEVSLRERVASLEARMPKQ